jgi:hypothetical protein
MGFFDKPFDSSTVDPQTAYKPIPDGEYLVLIKSAAEDKTKDRTGSMLHLTCKVLGDGPAKGKEIHWRVTLENKNPQAVEIGMKQLSAICRATGVKTLMRPGELVNKSMTIKVVVVPRSDNPKELTNDVRGVVLADEKKEQAAGTAGAAATDERPPWA